jgi:hypothetical protein
MENNLENLTIGVLPGGRGQCGDHPVLSAQGLAPNRTSLTAAFAAMARRM